MSGNSMRWRSGKRGHYEGWFVAFNNPAGEAGFWIRYSMVAPADEGREPFAQVWFMRTDRAAATRNRALRTTFSIQQLVATTQPFGVDVAGNRLTETGCNGSLEDRAGSVSWKLRFESLMPGFTPTPEWGALIATCFQEPQPMIRVTGEVIEDGRTRQVDSWLGAQAHVFGAKHSDRWHWAECKHLGRGRAFTGVAAWPRFPPRNITSLALLGGGISMSRTGTADLFRAVTKHSPEGWEFDAEYRRERLAGRITPRREDLIGITYHDPSGRPVYCYHSELADISLRYYRRDSGGRAWKLEEQIVAEGAAAFEYGSTTSLAGIPMLLD
ncbi:MAG TPA: hypothetical protein VGR61_00935 [Candidatus Dormibacteraeota bacterium]|nr:hypothetical protein [Candidatus Dormibacteraeota bacterium]